MLSSRRTFLDLQYIYIQKRDLEYCDSVAAPVLTLVRKDRIENSGHLSWNVIRRLSWTAHCCRAHGE